MANAIVTGGGINYGDILSSPYGPKGEIAPELALEQQRLNRRQQLAQLLLQQGGKVAPGQMVGRFYVGPDWKEGLTSLGSGLAGLGATFANQREQENIAKEAQQTREEDIQEFLRSQKDIPVVPPSQLDPGTFGARAQTVSAPAPREAVAQAMTEQGAPSAAPSAPPPDPILPGAKPPGFSGNYPVGDMPDESGWAPKGPIGDFNAETPAGPPPPQMQVAQAMVPPIQGPVSEGTIGRERTPEERQAALIRLMASRDPQAAAIGRFMAQQEATRTEKEDQRGFLREENKLNRAAKLDSDKAHIDNLLMMKVITTEQANEMKSTLQKQHDDTLKAMNASTNEARLEAARIAAASRKEVQDAKGAKRGQLPATALKMQQENLDAIGLSSSINADLGSLDEQVKSGKLKLGFLDNLTGTVKNYMGVSDEQSRNLASFKATLEKLRNDSLRLNKGTQTEGDAVRAWNEVMQNINDPGVVSQRLGEIRGINDRAANIKKLEVEAIRQNYGLESMETEGFTNVPAAVGTTPPAKGMTPTVPPFHAPEKQKKYEKSDARKYTPFDEWPEEKKQRYREFNAQHEP